MLGDGLRRAKMAERSVTVRGVSERDVTADLATWTVTFSDEGTTLAPVQASVDAAEPRGPRLLPARRLQARRDQRHRDQRHARAIDRDRKRGAGHRQPLDPAAQQRRDEGPRSAMPAQAELIRDGVAMQRVERQLHASPSSTTSSPR